MRHDTVRVFDDVIGVIFSGTTSFFTSSEYNEVLGKSAQVAIQVVVETLNTAPNNTLAVWLETSSDGLNWATKSSSPNIPATTINASGEQPLQYGCDDGALPSFGMGRLRFDLFAPVGVFKGRVRAYVTMREQARAYIDPLNMPLLPPPPPDPYADLPLEHSKTPGKDLESSQHHPMPLRSHDDA